MKGWPLVVFALCLLLPLQTRSVLAETCNAGHGCRITCADGCSAIYNLDTGQCSTACGKAATAKGGKGKRLNATFRDAPAGDVRKMLNGLK